MVINPLLASPEIIIALDARIVLHGPEVAKDEEVAILVTDLYQHQGLGGELLTRLIRVGGDEKLNRIVATILLENLAMRALTARYGFTLNGKADMGVVEAVLTL